MLIGQSEKYHNILQNAVWVVLHVNLSFTVFFVVLHKLHGQCMQILRSSCTAHANRTEIKLQKSGLHKVPPKQECKQYYGIFHFGQLGHL